MVMPGRLASSAAQLAEEFAAVLLQFLDLRRQRDVQLLAQVGDLRRPCPCSAAASVPGSTRSRKAGSSTGRSAGSAARSARGRCRLASSRRQAAPAPPPAAAARSSPARRHPGPASPVRPAAPPARATGCASVARSDSFACNVSLSTATVRSSSAICFFISASWSLRIRQLRLRGVGLAGGIRQLRLQPCVGGGGGLYRQVRVGELRRQPVAFGRAGRQLLAQLRHGKLQIRRLAAFQRQGIRSGPQAAGSPCPVRGCGRTASPSGTPAPARRPAGRR